MPSHPDLNGWPEGLSAAAPQFPRLPPTASDRERVHAYGTALLYVAEVHPKIVQALEYLYGVLVGLRGELGAALTHEARLVSLERASDHGESPSSVFLRESSRRELERKLKAEAARTDGPNLNAPVDRVAAIAEEVLTRKLAEREEQIRVKADRERLAAIDAERAEAAKRADALREEAAKAKRKFKRQIVYGSLVAFVVAAATAAGTAAWVRASALAEGHAAGVSDTKRMMQAAPPAAPRP